MLSPTGLVDRLLLALRSTSGAAVLLPRIARRSGELLKVDILSSFSVREVGVMTSDRFSCSISSWLSFAEYF